MTFSLFLRLGRISNLPTIATNVIAGALLSGANFGGNSLILLFAAFSAFYVGGMFLNDAFDAEYDKVHRPERPIPSGEVARRSVFVMGGGLLALGIMLVVLHGVLIENALRKEPILYAAALAVCIVWYDADHEKNWFSPVLMGLNRVYVYATTAYVLTPAPDPVLWYGSVALLSYLIGLTYFAKFENSAGWTNMWPLALVVLPVGYPAVSAYRGHGNLDVSLTMALGLCLLVWIFRSARMARPALGSPRLKEAVVGLIAGICLLDGLAAGLMGQAMWGVACGALFIVCLLGQRAVPGT